MSTQSCPPGCSLSRLRPRWRRRSVSVGSPKERRSAGTLIDELWDESDTSARLPRRGHVATDGMRRSATGREHRTGGRRAVWTGGDCRHRRCRGRGHRRPHRHRTSRVRVDGEATDLHRVGDRASATGGRPATGSPSDDGWCGLSGLRWGRGGRSTSPASRRGSAASSRVLRPGRRTRRHRLTRCRAAGRRGAAGRPLMASAGSPGHRSRSGRPRPSWPRDARAGSDPVGKSTTRPSSSPC